MAYHDVQRPEAYNLQGEVEYLAFFSLVMMWLAGNLMAASSYLTGTYKEMESELSFQ